MLAKFYSKKLLLLAQLLLLANFVARAQQQERRICGSEFSYEELINSKDAEFAQRYRDLDKYVQTYITTVRNQEKQFGVSGERSTPIVIPVVVHVVYNTTSQNVSDAQIQSQIDVLNRDYRRLNSDVSSVPAVFSGLTADCQIQFQLAVRDPSCNPTTGITRTNTSVTAFSVPSDAQSTQLAYNPVKSSAAGGHDAWPAGKYLNIWVCNMTGGILGYSSFPGFPANVDGVVIQYTGFGTTGSASSPFNLGRTATHEIGHYLNLFHIWGDDGGACTGSDQVDDTPNQSDKNFGCPTFPHVSCSNSGDMSMNYMDYTDDACMYMFSIGQTLRIDATLYGARTSLLASDGLVPASGIVGTTPDIFSQDTPDDAGAEPNTISPYFYESEDIWIRRQDDGITNQEHENPLYRPASSGLPNYVYVRVRNRSCTGASVSGTVKLYWAKASSALAWPTPWDGSVTSPALMGSPIATGSAVTIPPGGFTIVKFAWYPPNPSDYTAFGADKGHFCLLSRIETSSTAPFGMTTPETSNLGANVQNNNNIVWKNVAVENETTGGRQISSLIVGNFGKKDQKSNFYFKNIIKSRQEYFLQYGNITIDLGNDLFQKWLQAGKKSANIKELGNNLIQITNINAEIDGLLFSPGELYSMKVYFQFTKKIPFGAIRRFDFNVEQTLLNDAGEETFLGGQNFRIKSLNDNSDLNGRVLTLNVKAWLLGPFISSENLMIDSLRSKGILPETTPYRDFFTAVNNSSLETINSDVFKTTGEQAITDWAWLELRDSIAPTKIVSTRSALIRRDGVIVDMDGVSPVIFRNIPEGSYYVALRHRNHLGIMTASPVTLTVSSQKAVDFTSTNTKTYGNNGQTSVFRGNFLWPGDANRDGFIKYNGASNDKVAILAKLGLATANKVLIVYDGADLNLDGSVRYNGAGNDKNVILGSVGLSTASNIITEQLPQ